MVNLVFYKSLLLCSLAILGALSGGLAYYYQDLSSRVSDLNNRVQNLDSSIRLLQSLPKPCSYVAYWNGSEYLAANCRTGMIDQSGSKASTVINNALGNLTEGRTWMEKVVLMGSFVISASLRIPSYTSLEIQGLLVLANNVSNSTHLIVVDQQNHIDIAGGVLDGSRTHDPRLSEILITGRSYGINIHDVNIVNSSGLAIYVYESNDVTIANNVVQDSDDAGITVETATANITDFRISGNRVYGNGLTNNTDIAKDGIHVEGNETRAFVNGITITDNYVSGNRGQGITLLNTRAAIISNNQVTDNYMGGITTLHTDRIIISNNFLDNNDKAGVAGAQYGIEVGRANVTASTNVNIEGNTIKNHAEWAIIVRGASFVTITGNNVRENSGPGISSDATNQIIRWNYGYTTENSGTGTFSANSTVTVLDGLAGTPTIVLVTFTNSTAYGSFAITSRTTSSFTITVATAGNYTFDWYATM